MKDEKRAHKMANEAKALEHEHIREQFMEEVERRRQERMRKVRRLMARALGVSRCIYFDRCRLLEVRYAPQISS